MSIRDKASNKAEEFKGKAKETIGEQTGDDELAAEGRGDRMAGGAKQAGEHVKDAARDVKDAMKH